MEITKLVATRSTCLRRRVGAVLVREKRILSTGYNGAPRGLRHCLEIGCLHELCRALHAEQNAIIQAALHGVSVDGATLYCTAQPCVICSKMLINSGIRGVVYAEGYPDDLSRELLEEAGVALRCSDTAAAP
jgi:dCMP deaminase